MKVVILAGGLGTRLAEETVARPKPLVEIGGRPILWHIMKIFSAHGLNEFIICLGYKGHMVKEYFANYNLRSSNMTINLESNSIEIENGRPEPWKISLIDTGEETLTGGRIKRVLKYIGDDDHFLMTYGDGVGNVDIQAVVNHHLAEGRLATVTGAQPPGRFGQLSLDGNKVSGFREKPEGDGGWINAGFFVLSRQVGNYIAGDDTTWEQEPMERLAAEGQLSIYRHYGFWLPMDTLRDKNHLESLWATKNAPWKVWQ